MNSGIYQIRCIVNDKVYVGSTKNFNRRFYDHNLTLTKLIHTNNKLQNAWNKYGKHNFVFEILEYIGDISLLDDREKEYIKEKDSKANGYNIVVDWVNDARDKNSKQYIITDPIGNEFVINSLSEFCAYHNLSADVMRHVVHCRVNNHKGYKCRFSSQSKDDWEKNARSNKMGGGWKGNYLITDPKGNVHNIKSLTQFCIDNNLSQGNMTEVAKGKRKQHRGYACSYLI
jgi:group I intron endonuclease